MQYAGSRLQRIDPRIPKHRSLQKGMHQGMAPDQLPSRLIFPTPKHSKQTHFPYTQALETAPKRETHLTTFCPLAFSKL